MSIPHPPRDLDGKPRPANMRPIHLGSKYLRTILKTIHRRREREPELGPELNAMELYLWRQANQALNRRARGMPSLEDWDRLLRLAPPNPYEPPSRLDLRRKALAWQGLSKSIGQQRPLVDRPGPAPVIKFGRRRWQSPVPRGPPRRPMFSAWKLDYYMNQPVPSDPRDWISPALYKRLVQRGRMRK